MTPTTHPAVQDWLRAVDRALGDLPRARREELVDELREHVDAALAEVADPTEADVRTVLDRLGSPADIAAEAADRFGTPPRPAKRPVMEIVALVLLTAGSLVLPVIGWLIGIVLVWCSAIWETRHKVLATLLCPLGFLPAFYVLFFATGVEKVCDGIDGGIEHCVTTHQPSLLTYVVAYGLLALSVVGPFVTVAVLGRRLRRRPV
jgi:uncharacterized membrane protein